MGPEDLKRQDLVAKMMVGVVKVNNDDPSKLRRCRVFIPELHAGYADSELPWFVPVRGICRGSGPGVGKFGAPRVGSKVLCIFDQGDKNSGFILGEFEDGPSAVGGIADENYPDSYGFIDENGTYFKVNAATEVVTFHHKGATVTVAADGAISVNTPGTLTATTGGAAQLTIGGNATVNVTGTTSLTSSGNVTVDAPIIELKGGSGAAEGVVQQSCLCAFTKLPHPQVSSTVKGAL